MATLFYKKKITKRQKNKIKQKLILKTKSLEMDKKISFEEWKLANPKSKLCAVLTCEENVNTKNPLTLFKYPMKDLER